LFYAIMGAVLRHTTRGLSTLSQSLTIVSTVGLVGLAAVSCWSVTSTEFSAITTSQVLMMLAAGVFNALAFTALTRALQLTPLVYVHALNATQATMAAVAGVLIFGEAQSSFLVSGLVLTIAGLLFMHGARNTQLHIE
jgi:drug/metabolite transporter, DME family